MIVTFGEALLLEKAICLHLIRLKLLSWFDGVWVAVQYAFATHTMIKYAYNG